MILRTRSRFKNEVRVATLHGAIVRFEKVVQRGEAGDALELAAGPPAREYDDEPRRARGELADELRAQALDRRVLHVVKEMEVVDEPRRVRSAEAQQCVRAALGRVEHLD